MRTLYYTLTILFFLTACGTDKRQNNDSSDSFDRDYEYYETETEDYFDDEDEYYEDEESYEDGTYTATVDYYNPETGYSETYTLDVEVEDNQVTVIYFPNDGYLDDDHIWPTDLDDNGFASVDGEDGKTYDVQIDY